MLSKLFSLSLSQSEKELEKEAKFRKQIYELEAEISSLHEAIALIRAALKVSSQREELWRKELNPPPPPELESQTGKTQSPAESTPPSENTTSTENPPPPELKSQTGETQSPAESTPPSENTTEHRDLVFQAWKEQKLSIYVLRSLYHHLIELKRRFLHNWYQILLLELENFPSERRKSLKALLENSVDGALSAGIQLLEAQQTELLEKFLQKLELPRVDREPKD